MDSVSLVNDKHVVRLMVDNYDRHEDEERFRMGREIMLAMAERL